MPRRSARREDLFAELGLYEADNRPNPYVALGLDREFVRGLLKEDPNGAALQAAVDALARFHTKRYYPDVRGTGNREKFDQTREAVERIVAATPAELLGWARTETKSVPTAQAAKQRDRLAVVAQRAADLVRTNMELGGHPQHFSQLGWAQGILLRCKGNALLMRQNPEGGLRVLKGEWLAMDPAATMPSQALDFRAFLGEHGSFGLEPDAKITAYLDETGRASILKRDLSFVMDVTRPVAQYRERRSAAAGQTGGDTADAWSRLPDPVLLLTRVPGPVSAEETEDQILSFPYQVSSGRQRRVLARDLALEVAGTLGDPNFFNRVRHGRAVGAAALGGGVGRAGYFAMAPASVPQIVEDNAGYSPLIAEGGWLLLHDPGSNMPIATNAQVEGMIGSGSRY